MAEIADGGMDLRCGSISRRIYTAPCCKVACLVAWGAGVYVSLWEVWEREDVGARSAGKSLQSLSPAAGAQAWHSHNMFLKTFEK